MAPRQSLRSQSAIGTESEEDSQPVSTEQTAEDMLKTAKGIVEDVRIDQFPGKNILA